MSRRVVPVRVVSFSAWRVAGIRGMLCWDLELQILGLSSLSLLLWCPSMVFGGTCGAPVRVGFVSLAVAPWQRVGVIDSSICGLGLLWRM